MRGERPAPQCTDTSTGNWQRYATAGFEVQAATRVVENVDGRWVGTVTGLTGPNMDTDTDSDTDTVILHGEGAYEGLTAYVVIDCTASPIEFVAAMVPGETRSSPSDRPSSWGIRTCVVHSQGRVDEQVAPSGS